MSTVSLSAPVSLKSLGASSWPPTLGLERALAYFQTKKFVANGQRQSDFLQLFNRLRGELAIFTDQHLHASASRESREINRSMEECGYSLRMPDWSPGSDIFGIGMALKIDTQWSTAGVSEAIFSAENGMPFEGFKLLDPSGFVVHTVRDQPGFVLELLGSTGYSAFLRPHQEVRDEQSLLSRATQIHERLRTFNGQFTRAHVPKIYYQHERKLDWLTGLSVAGRLATLLYALETVSFNMNENGAQTSQAPINQASPSHTQNDELKIDSPFLCWISPSTRRVRSSDRPLVSSIPIFVGWFSYDSWQPIKAGNK